MTYADITVVPVRCDRTAAYEARDRGTQAATKDPRIVATMDEDPVFDGGRVLGNTFEVTMDLSDDA